MIWYLDKLHNLANELDRQGLKRSADKIDLYFRKYADEGSDRAVELNARTTYLMYKKYQTFLKNNLPKLDYLGKEVEIVITAFDYLCELFKAALRKSTFEYDHEVLENYQNHLKNSEKELHRSIKMKLTPVKVKVDKFLVYEELEVLVKKIERIYDQGSFQELSPVVSKARSVRDSFANLIKNVSEQITNSDLIETS